MRIRPFDARDAASVASLWQFWFRDGERVPDPGLTALARRIYAEHPNRIEGVTSLVAEDDDGTMLGFLGVTATPVVLDGKPATLAGVFPSVIDPERAPKSVASLLLRRFLAGPQAFSFSDGGHLVFERIWETLGGRIAQLQSLRWVKLFKPATMLAGAATQAGRRPLAPLAMPLAGGIDWLAKRVQPRRLTAVPPATTGRRAARSTVVAERLTPAGLAQAASEVYRGRRLRPMYEERYVAWLFAQMAAITEQGVFTARLLRDEAGDVAGWYVYYLNPGRTSRVFGLEAKPDRVDAVVDHLFADAEERGAGALIGRLEPRLRRPMETRGCVVHLGGSLMMLHARDASLLDDAELGRAPLSRLDGENWYWWAIVSRSVPSVAVDSVTH